ncbi:MAG: undecaprenyl-diphosphate phosphatase [Spirochaetales bacterium]|nr:undecaprenyl-diphosphate phosphatase [Spirochaetales bacterium]
MSPIESLLLGLLQGVTEFLPVSSSGHLVIARQLFEIENIPVLFDVLLHVSTLVAVLLVFRRRILAIFVSLIRWIRRRSDEEDRVNLKLVVLILIATVCTGLIGAGLSYLEPQLYPRLVASLFIVTGVILIGTKFMHGTKQYGQIGIREAVVTGLAQGIGVLPGISRSGITIAAAFGAGVDRQTAGEFSFVIAIPAIIGAALLDIRQAGELLDVVAPVSLAAGMAAAFLSGLACLVLLLRLIKSGRFYLFSIYLIPLGIALLIWGPK